MTSPTFLHLTDTHLALEGAALKWDDLKSAFPGIAHPERHEVLGRMLDRVAERLEIEGRQLDAVIFSGDAQDRGREGGHDQLLSLLQEKLLKVGIAPERIVAVPGNHDVPKGSAPSSPERYEPFIRTWRRAGCVTPWLDGVPNPADAARILLADDLSWAIYPINSCNWCHVKAQLPEELQAVWNDAPKLLAPGDAEKESAIRNALSELATFDMPRISDRQLEELRTLVRQTDKPAHGGQIRIAVLHHQLRSPSLREELKPFAEIPNLERLRAFLRQRDFHLVLHGHKHESLAFYDHIYDEEGETQHRILIVAGATFEQKHEDDAARLLTLHGQPSCPTLAIEPLPLVRDGLDQRRRDPVVRQLWTEPLTDGAPVVIQGSDVATVYDRARAAAVVEAARGTLITHLDLPSDRTIALPPNYPHLPGVAEANRQDWFEQLVAWWQLPRSRLQDRIPYVHGGRLQRLGGRFDQIERAISILQRESSSRALAVLLNPLQDFTADGQKEGGLPSFCLISFRKRAEAAGDQLDVIAYYRTQEFDRWWPINVAELRALQVHVASRVGARPGRITTVTPDARSRSPTPMQVSMPTIDRWLDQAPQRLYQLALLLTGKLANIDTAQEVVDGWSQTLSELSASITEYNPDGVPVALEGLETLHAYLLASSPLAPKVEQFRAGLETLIRFNRALLPDSSDRARYEQWVANVASVLPSLIELSADLLSPASPAID